MKIYVPDIENYKCFVIQNEQVIRGYSQIPSHNQDVSYRDFYYNSNYIYRDGTQSFGNYSTLPVCLESNVLTTDFVYRNDFDSILIIFIIMSIFIIFIPFKIFSRFFGRWLKL